MNDLNYSNDTSWMPDPDKDSRYYIWDVLFQVRIPRIDTYGEGYLRAVGVPVSTDEELNAILEKEVITTWKSINGMIDLFQAGGRVNVIDQKDCIKIYHYIDNHLDCWKKYLESSPINGISAPVDDLLLMDEFSELSFQYARWDLANNDKLSFLRRRLGSQFKYSVAALQMAIPTMEAIQNKLRNQAFKDAGSNLRIASADEITSGQNKEFDAFNYIEDRSYRTNAEIERNLPKRESYARFFEQYREDKSIMKLAPTADQMLHSSTNSAQSLNNKLGLR